MKKIKTAWLNFILHISAKINKSKEAIVEGGILQTLGVALKIVLLEVLLLIVSLPIYIFISPASFSTDKKEVQKYRLKRIISLVSVCTFIVIFLVASIFSGGIFLIVPAAELRADSIGWSFDSPKDYIYDSSKIQIIDGLVLFSPEDIAVKGLTEEFAESMTFKESLFEKLAIKTTETAAETTAAETTATETTAAETTAAETTAAETTAAETTATETTLKTPAETTPETPSETSEESVQESTVKTDETVQSSTEKLIITGKATIQAVNSLIVPNVASWDSFTEVSSKNGGGIYYQLSDDGGQSWYYWNSKWVQAGENDYNTAKEINEKIRDFPIDKGQILFKAFFITDFKSEMQLLDISIAFSQKIDEAVEQQDAEGQSNQAPTADAGGPYSVEVDSTVKLDGSASSDKDGTIISYKWKITEGPGSLTGNNSPIITYKAPKKLDSETKATVELTVMDDNKESDTVTAIIIVELVSNAAPTFAGASITGSAKVGEELTAIGESYNDVNGDQKGEPLYQWMICSTADGTYTEIPGAASSTYIPVITDLDKFIKAIVTPVAQTGTSPGMPVESIATAAVIKMTLDELKNEGAVSPDFNMWKDDPASGSILGAGGLIYVNNPNSDYSVTIRAKLQTGTLGGYGIFFDTTTDEIDGSKDNGYILQIDRGFGEGAVLIRPRINGVEKTPVKIVNSSSDGLIPKKSIDPLWWTAEHTVELKVSTVSIGESTNNKKIMVYIDGEFVLDYDYQIAIPKQDQKYYTGLRTWSVKSNFYSIALIPEAAPETAPTFTGATITGLAKVGSVLTAAGIGYNDLNGDLAATPLYQWTICDIANGTYIDISGATNGTYKPVFADLAKFIKVKVTPTALTGTSPGTTLVSAATAAILAASATAPSYTGAAITGIAQVGEVLKASGVGYADLNGDLEATPAYQWMICSTAGGTYASISGATSSTYAPVYGNLGKFIKVKVTPKALTGTSQGTPVISDATAAVIEYTPTISLGSTFSEISSGMIKLIEDYYAKYGKFPRSFSPYNYTDLGLIESEWNVAHNNIIYSPTGNRLNVKPADGYGFEAVNKVTGKTIRMPYTLKYNFVYYINEGVWYYHKQDANNVIDISTFKVYSVETGEIVIEQAAPAFANAIITGTGKVSTELTASGVEYADINNDLEATPLYQWKISNTAEGTYNDISGATNSVYTPAAIDLGKFIKVMITPTAQTGTSPGEPRESAAIECYSGKPKITINSAAQQTDHGYVYINYTLVDAENHAIDLSNYEYSLTGDFTGEESSMTAAASDDKHDGFEGLSSSAAGVEHTFVWDALSDLPGAHNLNLYIRLKPYDGIEQGEFAAFNSYITGFKKPVISNISALQTAGTNKVAVSYDLSADNDKLQVTLEISEDGGTTWTIPAAGITGDMGPEITTGTGRNIIWDAGIDFNGKDKQDMQIRLAATGAMQNTSDYAYSPLFALDTSAPLGLNDFLGVSADKSFIVWSWTPVVSETNFKYYKISYGQDLEDVQSATGTASVWDVSDDIDLSIAGTSGTIITGLSEGTRYYAKIWAVDNFGNQATVLESQFITKNAQDDSATVPPFTPILNQPPPSTQPGILVSGIADTNSDNDLYVDGELAISGFAQTQSDGRFNGTIKLDKGKHEIYVMSKDSDGNSSKRSNTINVDIDFGTENNQTSLTFPTITDKAGTDEATIIKDVYKAAESSILQRPQVIEVKGTDAGNNIKFIGKGVANSEVIVFIHSEQVIAYRVQVNENGDWSLNHSQDNAELAEGNHEVYALTLDAKSQAKSKISDIKNFQVKVSPLAVFLSYFDLPTTLLTIFVLLMGIVVFIIWRRKQTKTNKNNGNTA